MNENKILSVTENGVCTVTINNPESLNALNSIVIKELGKVFDDIAQDNDIKVVIITGAGRAFVAGADISEMPAEYIINTGFVGILYLLVQLF
jgi:enoyl-CoA hydratase